MLIIKIITLRNVKRFLCSIPFCLRLGLSLLKKKIEEIEDSKYQSRLKNVENVENVENVGNIENVENVPESKEQTQ